MPEPAAGVMSMSADDDDQADQRHELADPGTAETGQNVQSKFSGKERGRLSPFPQWGKILSRKKCRALVPSLTTN